MVEGSLAQPMALPALAAPHESEFGTKPTHFRTAAIPSAIGGFADVTQHVGALGMSSHELTRCDRFYFYEFTT